MGISGVKCWDMLQRSCHHKIYDNWVYLIMCTKHATKCANIISERIVVKLALHCIMWLVTGTIPWQLVGQATPGPIRIHREHHRDIEIEETISQLTRPLELASNWTVLIKSVIVAKMANQNISKFYILRKTSFGVSQPSKAMMILTRCKILFSCKNARACSCSENGNNDSSGTQAYFEQRMHNANDISDRPSLREIHNTTPPGMVVSSCIAQLREVHLPGHNHKRERPIWEDVQNGNKAVLFQNFQPLWV